MTFNIEGSYNEKKDILEIELSGDLDIYTSEKFNEEITKMFQENVSDINIEAKSLNYVDSTGLGVLMSLYKKVSNANKDIYILNAKPNIRKIFDITELDKLFNFRGESDE